jgi:hypothetical protein
MCELELAARPSATVSEQKLPKRYCHECETSLRSLGRHRSVQLLVPLIFKFPSNLPRELNGTPFYGVDIANGRLHPESGFKEFGRIKTIRLCHNNQPQCTIHLADTRRWQHVAFPDVYLNLGDTLAIEVLDTYPGKKEQTAAITEIVLQGAH